jgi:hypothetical protein
MFARSIHVANSFGNSYIKERRNDMRRILAIVLTIITIMLPAFAEENNKIDTEKEFSLGLGINVFTGFDKFVQRDSFNKEYFGLDARAKFSPNFGIILNVISCGSVQYYEDPPGSGDFSTYNSFEGMPFSLFGEDESLYKQTEYLVFPDLALFIPISIFQPYVALGPALEVSLMGLGYRYNTNGFKTWYDNMYGSERIIRIGWNVKAGCDIYIGFISIGIELNFIAHDIGTFIDELMNDPRYMIHNSWVGINALFWIQ